jgi:hypothetical protein
VAAPFRLWQRRDFAKLPATRWAVKNLVVLGGVNLLFGAPKNGKSFVAVSFACAVQAGVPWCEFSTRKLKVLYVATEGFYGLLRREAAWSKLHRVAVELRYFRVPINFFDLNSVTAALEALKSQDFIPELIIIDTLARSMAGGKENAAEDMSKVFDQIEIFRGQLDNEPTFVVVHHGTKDGLTYRGSSVIAANIDGAIEVSKEGMSLTLSCPMGMKDAPEFATFKVRLEQVPVETEDGGELVPVVKDRIDLLEMTCAELGQNEELAFRVLEAAPAGLTWSAWFKATKAAHGGKLGSSNFSGLVKGLGNAGRVKGGGAKGAVFQVVAVQAISPSTNDLPNTPHSRVKDPGVRSDSSVHSGITPGVKSELSGSCTGEDLVVGKN